LAELQILKEGKEPNRTLIVDYAIKIRRWLDKHGQATARKILQGNTVYYYQNQIKTYARG
jgi:hypothetical protein